jgi:hypothetical protein
MYKLLSLPSSIWLTLLNQRVTAADNSALAERTRVLAETSEHLKLGGKGAVLKPSHIAWAEVAVRTSFAIT